MTAKVKLKVKSEVTVIFIIQSVINMTVMKNFLSKFLIFCVIWVFLSVCDTLYGSSVFHTEIRKDIRYNGRSVLWHFLQNAGHKAVEMENCVISTLEDLQVDIENCLRQSCDTV